VFPKWEPPQTPGLTLCHPHSPAFYSCKSSRYWQRPVGQNIKDTAFHQDVDIVVF
jgi:hypothetical protein